MAAKRSAADYTAMAAEFEDAPTPARGPVAVGPGLVRLPNGRPRGRAKPAGNTPAISVRFPADVRRGLDAHAEVDGTPVAEIIRRAVVEYLDRHPV